MNIRKNQSLRPEGRPPAVPSRWPSDPPEARSRRPDQEPLSNFMQLGDVPRRSMVTAGFHQPELDGRVRGKRSKILFSDDTKTEVFAEIVVILFGGTC